MPGKKQTRIKIIMGLLCALVFVPMSTLLGSGLFYDAWLNIFARGHVYGEAGHAAGSFLIFIETGPFIYFFLLYCVIKRLKAIDLDTRVINVTNTAHERVVSFGLWIFLLIGIYGLFSIFFTLPAIMQVIWSWRLIKVRYEPLKD